MKFGASNPNAEDSPELNCSSDNCPTPMELVELTEKAPNKLPDHIKSCVICAEVMKALRDRPAEERNLAAFLARVKEEARQVEAAQASSVWTNLRALLALNSLNWGNASLVVVIALLICVWLWNRSPNREAAENKPVVMTFKPSKFEVEAQPLWTFYQQVANNNQLKPGEITSGVADFKQKLAVLWQSNLNDEQKAELVNLTKQLEVEAKLRQERSARSQPAKLAQAVEPAIPPSTSDLASQLKKAGEMYAQVGYSYAICARLSWAGPKKGFDPDNANISTEELYRTLAIKSGLSQVKLKAIKDNEIVVQDLNPDRDQVEKEALRKGLKDFSDQFGVKVKFESGSEVLNFVPAAKARASSSGSAAPAVSPQQ